MALGAVVMALAPARAAAQQPASALWMSVAFVLLLAGWGIATALGLLWMKVWALVSTLLFSCGMIGGAVGMMASVVNPVPAAVASTAAATAVLAVHVFQVVGGLVLLGLAVWWVIYFAQARTREAFFAARGDGAAPRLPVSLNLVAWTLLAAGAMCLATLPLLGHRAVFVVGSHVITGFHAEIGFWVLGAIGLVIGVGILELRGWARAAGVLWVLAGIAITTPMWLVPGEYVKVLQSASRIPDLAIPDPALGYRMALMSVGLAGGIVQIYFLWTRKTAFYPPAPAAVAVVAAAELDDQD